MVTQQNHIGKLDFVYLLAQYSCVVGSYFLPIKLTR